MSQHERTYQRRATYSLWHRPKSIAHHLDNPDLAHLLSMIDIDIPLYVEWHKGYRQVIGLIEVARDTGDDKQAYMLQDLARRADVPGYVVLYTPSRTKLNPADPTVPDIDQFRVKKLWPNAEPNFKIHTPREWAARLVQLREGAARKSWRESRQYNVYGGATT